MANDDRIAKIQTRANAMLASVTDGDPHPPGATIRLCALLAAAVDRIDALETRVGDLKEEVDRLKTAQR